MPVSFKPVVVALSFCALTLPGLASPAVAQAGDSASQRAFAATATLHGPSLTIGTSTIPLTSGQVHLASGVTTTCPANGCATLTNTGTKTSITTANGPQLGELNAAAFSAALSGLRGEGGKAHADLSVHGATVSMDGLAVDVVLDEGTLNRMDAEVRKTLRADLTEFASKLEPLATAAGPGPIAELLTTVRDLSKDLGSRPFLRITQAPSSLSIDGLPNGSLTAGSATITMIPTDSGSGLITIDVNESALSAQALAAQSATGTITPGAMRVVLLPGLMDSLPAAVGTSAELAGTPVAQVLAQLPKAASGILGPRFNATDSALTLDEPSGGLAMDVTPSTERACWFDTSLFETCVESGIGQRTTSDTGFGVGVVSQPARLGTLRQNLVLRLHEASLGVNSEGQSASSAPQPRAGHDTPLPRTGASLPPIWVLLTMALSSVGVLLLVRPGRR